MNKFFYSIIGLGLFATSCQNDVPEIDQAVNTGDGNVTFVLSAPEVLDGSRAAFGETSNSARGGLTNVDMNAYDIRYKLAVYRVNDDNTYTEVVGQQVRTVDQYEPVTFSLRLTPNRAYKVVAWADFVEQGSTADLHYNTENLENITCIDDADHQLNDESRDAYWISKDLTVGETGITESIVLRRPFAKVRIVATDWAVFGLEMPDNFRITYKNCSRFTNINAVTGVSESEEVTGDVVYTGSINKNEKEYALNYDMAANNRTLTVDYLMTDVKDETAIHFDFEALDGDKQVSKHALATDIPIKRNWLTTIIGNILSVDYTPTIKIDENFENNWYVGEEWWDPAQITPVEPAYDEATKTYTIQTRDEFAWLPDNAETLSGKTIVLANDIDMSGIDWKPIFTNGETTYTVDGRGHTLRNFSMNGRFGTVYEYSTLGGLIKVHYNAYTGVWGKFEGTMKDLYFENITINGRADDEQHYGPDGQPIDHSAETSYFAGCIGYTGANYSTKVNISNVHVRNIVIKASKSTTIQNVGGLIGWIGVGGGDTWLRDCSVVNAQLQGGSQIGGLVGQIVSGRGVSITNCSTDYITLRKASASSRNIAAFVGQINDGSGVVFNNCTPAPNINVVLNTTGQSTTYNPAHPLYGAVTKNAANIKILPEPEAAE